MAFLQCFCVSIQARVKVRFGPFVQVVLIKPQQAGHTLAMGGILIFSSFSYHGIIFHAVALGFQGSRRDSFRACGAIWLTALECQLTDTHTQRDGRMKGQNQEVCVHGECVCLVWGSSNTSHIIYLYLWLWKVNVFFMCTGEEVHRGISHKVSLWDAGHNFRKGHTLRHKYDRWEFVYVFVCLKSTLEKIYENWHL